MEGDEKETGVKEKQSIESIKKIMVRKSVRLRVRSGLRNGIVLPTMTYTAETWARNGSQEYCIYAAK